VVDGTVVAGFGTAPVQRFLVCDSCARLSARARFTSSGFWSAFACAALTPGSEATAFVQSGLPGAGAPGAASAPVPRTRQPMATVAASASPKRDGRDSRTPPLAARDGTSQEENDEHTDGVTLASVDPLHSASVAGPSDPGE
jgi:hypothetical protein